MSRKDVKQQKTKHWLLVSKMVVAIVKNLSEQMSHCDIQIWQASQDIKYLSINETDVSTMLRLRLKS